MLQDSYLLAFLYCRFPTFHSRRDGSLFFGPFPSICHVFFLYTCIVDYLFGIYIMYGSSCSTSTVFGCNYLTVQHKTNAPQNGTSPEQCITRQCHHKTVQLHNGSVTKLYQQQNRTVIKRYCYKTVQLLSVSILRRQR